MHRLFKLGGFCFAADHPDTLVFPPNFLRFETKDVQPAYFYTLRFVKSIPNPVGVCTAVREDLIVYRDGEKESRLLGIQGMLGFYALYRELDDTHAEVMIAEDCRGCLVFDPVFASLFALERRMLQKDSFILHSAYIRHRGRAILFSAPSGTGKSTQASLWAQYAGAVFQNRMARFNTGKAAFYRDACAPPCPKRKGAKWSVKKTMCAFASAVRFWRTGNGCSRTAAAARK